MLGVGWFAAAPSEPIAPRGHRADRRGAAEPAAAVLAMLRELSMSAAMRSDPEGAIDRARPVYRAALRAGGASMRLTDCLVGGVFHFARAVADTEAAIVAPVACVATGSYAAGPHDRDGGLLLLVEERGALRIRGEPVAALIAFMLGEFEAGLRTTVRTPADCALRAEALPSFGRSLARRRFLRGRHALFDALGHSLDATRLPGRMAA